MSFYKKPSKVRYVDMCIYIDEHVYNDNLTEEEDNLIYEYLYHLAKMLAYKAGYFRRSEYYDDFAIFFATSMYMRLKNPKQYQLDAETGEPKLEKIKSVLNYMKNVAYMRKIEFEQDYYSQALSQQQADDLVSYDSEFSFADKLSESIDDISLSEFDMCLGDICKTTKMFLKKIPYKSNTVIWHNIYLSCMLTLLNTITLSNRTLARLDNLKFDIKNRPKAWNNLYKPNPETQIILYHVDKNMRDYIWILVQEIKHLLAKDLSLTTHTYIPYSSSTLNTIAIADINMEDYYETGEQ